LAGLGGEAIFRDAPVPHTAPRAGYSLIDAAGGLVLVALRFLAFAATTGALGAWVFAHLVVARMPADTDGARRSALQDFAVRVAVWCTTLIALTSVARLVAAAVTMHTPGGNAPGAALDILRTAWGAGLVAQGVAAAVAAGALRVSRRAQAWPRLTNISVAALAIVPPFLAHAGTAPTLRAVSVVVDLIHGAAAGGWVGTLGLLTATVLRERRLSDGPARSATLIAAFHPVALIAAGAVFATGLGTAWLRMGAPEGIAAPTYSGLFVAKLLLAGVVGAYGAGHAKLATRRGRAVDPRAVGRSLAAECVVAMLVLAVTAVLVGVAPIG